MINDLSNLLKGSALQKRFCIAIHMEEQKVTGLKKNRLGSLFLLAASATAVLGRNIVTDDYFVGRSLPAVIASIAEMIILFAAMACACAMFRMLFRTAESSVPGMPVLEKWFFAACVSLNLVFLLGYYPGTGTWDTYAQLNDYFDGMTTFEYAEGGGAMITALLNDHHPVFTTVLFSFFVSLGRVIGNERAGYSLYILLQVILCSYAYTRVLFFLRPRASAARFFTIIFYALNPFLCYYAINMLKDSLYSALLLLYLIDYLLVYLQKEPGLSHWPKARILLYSVLIPLTKKTGIYLILLSNAVLLFQALTRKEAFRRKLSYVWMIVLPAMLMFVLLPQVLFPTLNIYSGGKQEMLATLFQQTARLKIEHPDAYTSDEAKIIDAVFSYDDIEAKYNKGLTDPIKNTFHLESVTDKDLQQYLSLWFRKGLQYPLTYLRATFSTCAGYFSPTTQMKVYKSNHSYPFSNRPVASGLREALQSIYEWMMETPGVSVLTYMVIYTWWIPLLGTYRMIRKRGFRAVFALTPAYVSILILVVSPFSFSRYALPLVMMAPLILFSADCADGV